MSVLDIGCGCGELIKKIIGFIKERESTITLVDSPEMLSAIPESKFIEKVSGEFPGCSNRIKGRFDAIICYSVMQYVLGQHCVFNYIENIIELLKPQGQALLGDIPSLGKRKRLFNSEQGKKLHRELYGEAMLPDDFTVGRSGAFNDQILTSVIQYARERGVDAYLLPQSSDLHFANRREDILLVKP